jgi:CubicO group peptidase (beta-lactamase class C family)
MNRSLRLITIIVALIAAGDCVTAQKLAGPIAAKVDSIFADYTRPNRPGCALAIYRNDQIIYEQGYGLADIEHQVPITPQSVFCIGSTSKQFTATTLILLAQQKKLSLDDDIRKYLPELPDYGHTITIRHLLNHTSGIRDYIGLLGMSGIDIDDVVTNDDVFRMLVRQKDLNFEPGTKHRYSNSGYVLAAMIVQRVSGQPLRQFAQEHIFTPLGMEHTTFINDHTELIANRAIGYSPRGDSAYRRDVSYWEDYGAGNIYTTVEDLLKWDRNFYKPKIGGPELNSELTRRGILNNGDTLDYAEGLYYEDVHGLKTIQHGGAESGYRAQLVRVPSEHLTVALLCNSSSSDVDQLTGDVLQVVLADKIVKEAVAEKEADSAAKPQAALVKVDPAALDAYAGEYELSDQAGYTIKVERAGDHLYASGIAQERVVEEKQELLPTSDSTFFPEKEPDVTFTFHRDSDTKVMRFTLHESSDHPAVRVRATPWTDQELSIYAGTYYSPELDTRYTVVADSGKLVAKHSRLAPVSLTPPRASAPFRGDKWYLHTVTFEKGADGRAQVLVGSGSRAKIRFEREK